MSKRIVIVIVVLLAAATWWFLRDDPEAEVRQAHQELTRLMSKAEGEAGGTMILNARILQTMFADSCEVSGDADVLAGTYTPEEMVSTVIRVQGLFLRVELTFHELSVEFPSEDHATANFVAVLVGKTVMEGEGEVEAGETRAVTSHMRNVDGKWLFTAFELARLPETE